MSAGTITYAGIGDEAGLEPRAQIGALARLGWTAIELRTVHGSTIADLDERRFTEFTGALRASGLRVVCVASRIGSWARPITGTFDLDLHELEVLARRCAALGTRQVRIMSCPNDGLSEREWQRRSIDRIRILVRRAEQAGLVLLHENCSGWAGTSAERMLRLIDEVDSPALRLLFDTGNGVAHGYHAYDLLTDIAPHVAHVHVKDADGDCAEPVYVLPGAGRARVADCLRLLLRRGYCGVWSIEPHLDLRPHEQQSCRAGAAGSFVAAGVALADLVRDQVLPAVPGWAPVPGGAIRRPDR
ncbi:MAG: sugar phosphate isomerase/epimerase family protein [Pseudonocardiaceae bacterium]